jgi:hypothetical protein
MRLRLIPIPHAMHGEDGDRGIGMRLHFLAQLGDMLVERAGGAEIIDPPRGVQQHVPAQHLVGVGPDSSSSFSSRAVRGWSCLPSRAL